jgi:hypothetical protein
MAVDDSYTKSLIHFNDGDEAVIFTDESGKVWTAHGDVHITNDQSKFDGLSGAFDGLTDYIDTPADPDWNLGTGNFTIDFWVYITNGAQQTLFSLGDGTADNVLKIGMIYSTGSPTASLTVGGVSIFSNLLPNAVIAYNAWNHLALVRYGADFRLYAAGQHGTPASSAISIPDATAISISGYRTGGTDYDLYGYIDEFRFSRTARWIDEFTPPTAPYGPVSPNIDASSAPLSAVTSFSGSISRLIPAAALTAVGTFVATRSAFVTAPELDLVSELSVSDVHVTTILRQNLPMLTCSATLAVRSGILHAEIPGLTVSATGKDGGIGHLSKTLPALTMAAFGGAYAQTTLPVITLTATGKTGDIANLAQYLPALSCAANGFSAQMGWLSMDMPKLTLASHGYNNGVGSASLSLRALTIMASGLTGSLGTVNATLPALTGTGVIVAQGRATLQESLPGFYILAAGRNTAATPVYAVLAMNPRNLAVGDYDGFEFNSFACFNGVYLGAKATGIHVLSGDLDNTLNIDAELKTGCIPCDRIKPRDVWILGRSTGGVVVTLTQDEGTPKEVSANYVLETLGTDRVKVPRGFQPTYFQVGIKNKNGSDFDIDGIQIIPESIRRKQK